MISILKNTLNTLLVILGLIILLPLITLLIANAGIIYIVLQLFQQWYTFAYLDNSTQYK